MNKDIMRIGRMALAGVLVVVAVACSKDHSGDVRGLLETIPADASAVVAVNVESVAKKAHFDAKLDSCGVEPTVVAIFVEGYNTYLTGYVADSGKFKSAVEKKHGEKFVKAGDVESCGNVAVSGSRFWMCLNSHNTVNVNDVKHYQALSNKQSILQNEVAARICDLEHDACGWGDIKGCLNVSSLEFSDRASASMAIEMMFDDATDFLCEADVKKNKIEAEVEIINSKGGIAKFNFPTAKIDSETISAIGTGGDGIAAVALSPAIVRKLREETGGKGISMLGMVAGMLSGVDGTAAVAFSGEENVNGLIATSGGNDALTEGLSQLGYAVSKDNGYLRFAKGKVQGIVTTEDAAEELKGALAGVVVDSKSEKVGSKLPFSTIVMKFVPEKGGLQMQIKLIDYEGN